MGCTITDLSPLIARVWPRLVALVAHIAAMVARASPQDRAVRLKAMRLLRPAEALARRIIVLLADQMNPGPLPSQPGGGTARKNRDRKRYSTGFTLFEPVATCAASIGKAGRRRRFSSGPRIVDLLGAHVACAPPNAASSEPPPQRPGRRASRCARGPRASRDAACPAARTRTFKRRAAPSPHPASPRLAARYPWPGHARLAGSRAG